MVPISPPSSSQRPDIPHHEPFGKRIVWREHVLGETGDPRTAANRRNDGRVWPHAGFFDCTSDEDRVQNPFLTEVGVKTQSTPRMERRDLRRRPGAAG